MGIFENMHTEPAGALICDIAVVGGGLAGLTAAVALASAHIDTLLVAPPYRPDNRTTALLGGSVAALETLGVWERCRAQAAPLRAIRLVDDTGRLLRAPEVVFEANEIGLECFGYNVENRHLIAGLAARAAELPALRIVTTPAVAVSAGERRASVALAGGGRVEARLVVGADGRNSLCRQAAGIATREWRYPQSALTCNLKHRRQHQNISTEFHTPAGPFTLVPLAGERSSLVWVTEPEDAERLAALDDAALSLAIERRSHSILGKVAVEPGRGLFPLVGMTAQPFAANRIALIGEAAHVIPPIGAQGFNLGLRDAVAVAELAAEAVRAGADPGAPALLDRFDAARRADTASRALAVDLLNRSLLTDLAPVQALRGFGVALLDSVGPLRRALMREGLGPRGETPRLMRGMAL